MPEWWQVFFDSSWQEIQLELAAEDVTAAVDAIERTLGLAPPATVLDVPCGEGRIARELAARGHRVTGVDLTERFLEEGRRRSAAQGVDVTWVHSDMRSIHFDREFDAALNYWGSFGYFDDEGDAAFASAVAQALRPGGRFLVETLTLEALLPDFRDRWWHGVGGYLFLQQRRFDHETSRAETEWTLIGPGGERETRFSSIRLYSYAELTDLLRGAGFVSFDGYETGTLKPFGLGSSRLTLVATAAA